MYFRVEFGSVADGVSSGVVEIRPQASKGVNLGSLSVQLVTCELVMTFVNPEGH